MSSDTRLGVRTRSPSTVGYLPWLLHRLSALALVPLVGLHLGVQLYPEYGFSAVYSLGIYHSLLDLTLGLVLLHGVLGIRATVIETSATLRTKTTVVRVVSLVALGLFVYRLFG